MGRETWCLAEKQEMTSLRHGDTLGIQLVSMDSLSVVVFFLCFLALEVELYIVHCWFCLSLKGTVCLTRPMTPNVHHCESKLFTCWWVCFSSLFKLDTKFLKSVVMCITNISLQIYYGNVEQTGSYKPFLLTHKHNLVHIWPAFHLEAGQHLRGFIQVSLLIQVHLG